MERFGREEREDLFMGEKSGEGGRAERGTGLVTLRDGGGRFDRVSAKKLAGDLVLGDL